MLNTACTAAPPAGKAALRRRAGAGTVAAMNPPANDLQAALTAFEQGDHARAERLLAPLLGDGLPAGGWSLAGLAAAALGDWAASADRFGRAAMQAPAIPSNAANQATALLRLGRLEQAAQVAEALTNAHPGHGAGWNALGGALHGLGRFAAAREALEQAVALSPDMVDARISLGAVAKDQGDLSTAIAHLRAAVAQAPGHADAHWNLAVSLLTDGQWEAGWREAEWRRRHPRFSVPRIDGPEWRGEDPAGKTILVHAEQGRGDNIQFARLLPELAWRGAKVLLQCQPELVRLFHSVPGIDQVVARGQAVPAYDIQVPMLTLPHRMGVTLDRVPGPARWLSGDPDAVAGWRERLGPGLKAGLVWAGQPGNPVDVRRSVTPDILAPLGRVQGVRFVGLQHGAASAQGAGAPFPILDLSAELTDFAATAAIVAALDLVIGVDTAVIHLAGALGRPVWLLNRYDTCWRWLRGRDDSPWYPTLRQFRQTEPGDWTGPVERAAKRLAAMASL